MTWIALVGPEIEENLSLRYLASKLATVGIRSELVPFDRPRDLSLVLKKILDAPQPPALVGISLAFQWRAVEMMAVAMGLRDGGYTGHITMGGHFATFACKDLLRDFAEIDSIVRHEGEETLLELVQALQRGESLDEVPGVALRDGDGEPFTTPLRSPPDLQSLPPPDRRGPPGRCFGRPMAPLVSSRGCYANCAFCCIAAWHEQTLPGKRYRVRPVEDVADEMVALQRERGVQVFIFHDDNFFVPSKKVNLKRLNGLADALEARGIGPFGIVVKARPNDVDPEVFTVLRDRLHVLRSYVGIETDADQGLVTLSRRLDSVQNHQAIKVMRELGIFGCFNMLVFDPDTTLPSFEVNLDFMQAATDFPFNFCRTELYAGTPLLQRMLQEKRVEGDYLHYTYKLRTPTIQRIFEMSMHAFSPRNFGGGALHNNMGGWRLQLETCKRFFPEAFKPEWLDEMKGLHRRVGSDTVAGLRKIVAHVKSQDVSQDLDFVRELNPSLRALEAEINAAWENLNDRMVAATNPFADDLQSVGVDATGLQNATPVKDSPLEVLHYV